MPVFNPGWWLHHLYVQGKGNVFFLAECAGGGRHTVHTSMPTKLSAGDIKEEMK